MKPRPPDVGGVSPGKAALDKPVFLHLHPILFHLSDGQIERPNHPLFQLARLCCSSADYYDDLDSGVCVECGRKYMEMT